MFVRISNTMAYTYHTGMRITSRVMFDKHVGKRVVYELMWVDPRLTSTIKLVIVGFRWLSGLARSLSFARSSKNSSFKYLCRLLVGMLVHMYSNIIHFNEHTHFAIYRNFRYDIQHFGNYIVSLMISFTRPYPHTDMFIFVSLSIHYCSAILVL